MSWMKRAQGGAAPPGAERQPYAAPQPPQAQSFGNQQNMYPNYQGGSTGNTQPQQFWQMPAQQQPQYNQQYGQVYHQQDYPANANQIYQQSNPNQFNQNYTSQGLNSSQQQNYQQNYYQNQGANPQPQNFQNKPNTDSWEDNWDWGWEESAKQAQIASQNAAHNAVQQPPPPQQQVANNANVIEESFATTDSWNWSMDDKKDAKGPAVVPQNIENKEPTTLPISNPIVENSTVPEPSAPRSTSNLSAQQAEEVRTLNDREVVKERLPNLALGKRFHIENLTPQWSIESQMSQESSDGPHTQSEGTYRSENQSRNSSKSSPGLNTDSSNFNYSQAGLDEGYPHNIEWTRPVEEPTLVDSVQSNSRRESHDELSGSMQEMRLNNHENPSTETLHQGHEVESGNSQDHGAAIQPPLAVTPANFPAPSNFPPPSMSAAMPPPPPVPSVSLPPSISSTVVLSAPASSSAIPPPNFPPLTSSQNPFKMNAGPFSHKTIAKVSTSATSIPAFPPQMSSTNLTSPTVVSKVSQQNRVPVGFEANLETTPDNSERPDQPQISAFRPMPVSQQVPDNMEVAPRNDRNEYLQTAHLSSGDYGENTDFSRGAPPPGLRRMVVGQQESEYNQNLNNSGDEPPPGLARMVPGQQTEAENAFNQTGDNYLDRHIDGQPTDSGARPYRQAEGQQTPDNYTQPPQNRGTERRPIGLDRMVPGEPSNDEYPQYQGSNYAGTNEQRVVTGLDHEFSIPAEAGPPDVREQNVDGSDYTEQGSRNPPRNIIGARESSNDASPDFSAPPDEQQREVTMEGENLQDLSIISSTELTYSREQVLDGADITLTDLGTDRKTDLSDSIDHPATSSRRQSLNRVNTSGEDSERDRAFKSSPRRDRDKHKSTRDRDQKRDRDRDRERDKDGRYSRGDRKYDPDRRSVRDDRRAEKDRRDRDGYTRDRREREESPDARRHRRSTRSHRYETEDTDYYSDRERDRRRHREGSYTSSKPPRPDDKERRYGDERDRSKRYHTIERDRRYEDDRERRERRRGERPRERYERAYRDIDPSRKYGNLRQRDKDDRRVVTFSSDAKTNDSCMNQGEFSSPSRPDSREATVTDDDLNESRRRGDTHRRARRTAEPFYDVPEYVGGGYPDPYLVQRQQYQYYEQLRHSNPAAYMQVYKQLMAGHAPPVPLDYRAPAVAPVYDDFGSLPYDGRREERGSVHSGRSSTTGLKGNDTYYGYRLDAAGSLRDAPSLRTDLSDRDLNTDMSLNLHLEESTVRSERMTPFRYSTAHIKGSVSTRDVVVVRPSYPVDGVPATVHIVSLAAALAHHPHTAELAAFPGPLVKGVTHKKSVIDYCGVRIRSAEREGARDVTGYVLLWDLLALMLRQNGVVVGSDIAELLMKNTREYEYKTVTAKTHNESRRGSSQSGEGREGREGREDEARSSSPDQPSLSMSENLNQESLSSPGQSALDERAALDTLRELLIYGNRQEALEWAMNNKLWGHALQLAAHGERRTRAAVAARFVAALPRADPLHTLYAALAAAPPPAATCVSDERWGDWRPHAAVLLANPSARPDHDRRTLTQMGDSLSSRGLLYSAQVCYLSAGVQFSCHPLAPLAAAQAPSGSAPPRLALLLADPRASSLQQLTPNRALFATEVYEYAMSLNQDDFVVSELQPYKLMLACRLLDCGLYERALAYIESAARAVTRAPRDYSNALITNLATLADRLKYHDPALQEDPPLVEEPDSAEPSPRHHQQWLDDVKNVANMLNTDIASQQTTPQHNNHVQQQQQQYGWEQQAQQYQQPVQTYPEPPAEETPDYAAQYYTQQQQAPTQQQTQQPLQQPAEEPPQYGYDEWPRSDEQPHTYADPYWHADQGYAYGEPARRPRPSRAPPALRAPPTAGATPTARAPPTARVAPTSTPTHAPPAPPADDFELGAGGAGDADDVTPTITMPGANKSRAPYYHDYDDRNNNDQQNDRDTDSPKTAGTKKQESKSKEESLGGNQAKGKGGGWLGGILTKLSLRPPNQMILPDDKNPTIVWDADTKRWRNLDGDGDDADLPPPPPPKTTDLPHALQNTAPPLPSAAPAAGAPPAGAPPAAPVSNIFKMQKGRHIKKSYVDVFNPSGAATRALPPAAEVLGPAAPLSAPTNYFVPAPVPQVPEVDRPEAIEVMICSSPSETPPPSPISDADPDESGVYEPSMVETDDDRYQHSGI